MRFKLKLITLSLLLLLALLTTTHSRPFNCGSCYTAAINYGATAQEACLTLGGSESFCDALFHAEVCLYLSQHCDCPGGSVGGNLRSQLNA